MTVPTFCTVNGTVGLVQVQEKCDKSIYCTEPHCGLDKSILLCPKQKGSFVSPDSMVTHRALCHWCHRTGRKPLHCSYLEWTPWQSESSSSLSPNLIGSSTQTDLTPRWSELSRSKKINAQVTLSPEWEVSEWALKAVPSQRLCRLALPRLPAAEWQPERPLLTPLSRSTQTAIASSRLCQLAQPKSRPLHEGSDPRARPAPLSHKPGRASAHIELLAIPKNNHPKFVGDREVRWPVPASAQKAVASPRVRELSNPKERKALYEGFNPYIISRAARSACPSARVRQLSLPLPRKCSSQ